MRGRFAVKHAGGRGLACVLPGDGIVFVLSLRLFLQKILKVVERFLSRFVGVGLFVDDIKQILNILDIVGIEFIGVVVVDFFARVDDRLLGLVPGLALNGGVSRLARYGNDLGIPAVAVSVIRIVIPGGQVVRGKLAVFNKRLGGLTGVHPGNGVLVLYTVIGVILIVNGGV